MNLNFMKRFGTEIDRRYVEQSVDIKDLPIVINTRKLIVYPSSIKALDDIPMEEFGMTCEIIDSVLDKIKTKCQTTAESLTTVNLISASRATDHLTDMLGVLRIVGDCHLDHLQTSDKTAFLHFAGPSNDEYRQSPFSILFDNECESVQVVKDIGAAGGTFYSFNGTQIQYGFMCTLINGQFEPITCVTYSFFGPGKSRMKFEVEERGESHVRHTF